VQGIIWMRLWCLVSFVMLNMKTWSTVKKKRTLVDRHGLYLCFVLGGPRLVSLPSHRLFWDFRCFPQSVQKSSGICLKTGNDCFLFIIFRLIFNVSGSEPWDFVTETSFEFIRNLLCLIGVWPVVELTDWEFMTARISYKHVCHRQGMNLRPRSLS
jgi:hypothetical protein